MERHISTMRLGWQPTTEFGLKDLVNILHDLFQMLCKIKKDTENIHSRPVEKGQKVPPDSVQEDVVREYSRGGFCLARENTAIIT